MATRAELEAQIAQTEAELAAEILRTAESLADATVKMNAAQQASKAAHDAAYKAEQARTAAYDAASPGVTEKAVLATLGPDFAEESERVLTETRYKRVLQRSVIALKNALATKDPVWQKANDDFQTAVYKRGDLDGVKWTTERIVKNIKAVETNLRAKLDGLKADMAARDSAAALRKAQKGVTYSEDTTKQIEASKARMDKMTEVRRVLLALEESRLTLALVDGKVALVKP
jgi:hypothetical protein